VYGFKFFERFCTSRREEWGDKGIELYQFEARMYDPVIGRWGSHDPLEQFHSPYLANFNNPANFVDPDGRSGNPFWKVIGHVTTAIAANVDISAVISQGSSAGGTMNVAGAAGGTLTVALKLTAVWMSIENVFNKLHNSIVQLAKSKTAGAGAGSGGPNWYRDGKNLKSYGGDNVETLLAYLHSEGYQINYDEKDWNNGQPTKPGIHKYEVYNILKAAGYMDADLDPDNDIAIPIDLIEFIIAQRGPKANLKPSDHPIAPPSDEDLEGLHTALNLLGLIPVFGEVFDGVNAVIYLCEGDYVNAAGAVVCMTVGVGTAVALAKLGEKAVVEAATKTSIQLTKKTFGHTFTTHGDDMTNFLVNRAKGSGMAQGQFLDNQKAAQFILDNVGKTANGAVNIPIPKGFPARIIMPDGTFKAATHIRLVPGGGGVKTAYPIIH
jgi:RHS repeat-associated protein